MECSQGASGFFDILQKTLTELRSLALNSVFQKIIESNANIADIGIVTVHIEDAYTLAILFAVVVKHKTKFQKSTSSVWQFMHS